jgi:hypothetical protein
MPKNNPCPLTSPIIGNFLDRSFNADFKAIKKTLISGQKVALNVYNEGSV